MTWNIWSLTSHTHLLGQDFDIYIDGIQEYEGFFNQDYSFNQGYYDNEHPAIRRYFPLLTKSNPEFIFESEFFNPGPDTVRFGGTVNDEMMLFQVQYTAGDYLLDMEREIAPAQSEYHNILGQKGGGMMITRQKRVFFR